MQSAPYTCFYTEDLPAELGTDSELIAPRFHLQSDNHNYVPAFDVLSK